MLANSDLGSSQTKTGMAAIIARLCGGVGVSLHGPFVWWWITSLYFLMARLYSGLIASFHDRPPKCDVRVHFSKSWLCFNFSPQGCCVFSSTSATVPTATVKTHYPHSYEREDRHFCRNAWFGLNAAIGGPWPSLLSVIKGKEMPQKNKRATMADVAQQ